ncbi:UDP-glucose 4-epimerase GalE [Streptococcus sp. 121]|uniref:UDP-glucose 4-epimerase GalE n=1 Tax=Streptococcus sp. 121 TaxID=2797637 RepID=UPI0018F0CC75|nr:UDP-glucose 4-epimerase GalE [Streptococcus sp. 121]MBJ6745092.1 UDP-glucose 4-epimerase GalE [Streptococcus sp. 121]
MAETILVTGGAGYIGSHTVLELLETSHRVVVLDNFSNSHPKSLEVVKELTGQAFPVYVGDVRDKGLLEQIFQKEEVTGVIHFAGFKAVGESSQIPLAYYDNNLVGLLHLLEVMQSVGCRNLIFSSSATVYGDPQELPLTETAPLSVTNPYGRTKLMGEEILRDLFAADGSWNLVILRYFNPIGAHPSGRLGEHPQGIPSNLVPYITQVACGLRDHVRVFGDNYATPDGTGVRDYIHIQDLSRGHVAAMKRWATGSGLSVYNLGTGQGYSVLEMIRGLSQTAGQEIPYQIYSRRPGDIAACYADPTKAREELGWEAQLGLEEMCRHAWKWQRLNPNGFQD